MFIPPGKTEKDVLDAIEKSVALLATSFTFGFFDVDDIKQQGRLYALQVLEKRKYDPSRPLENFLYTHIRNRLINLRRDKLRRTDAPCAACHQGLPCEKAIGKYCRRYADWLRRNTTKANLMRPLDISSVPEGTASPSEVVTDVETTELLRLIDMKLPVVLRTTYLQMRAGVSVPKARRIAVEGAVREILRAAGVSQCPSEDD